jgi:hypothetical protein
MPEDRRSQELFDLARRAREVIVIGTIGDPPLRGLGINGPSIVADPLRIIRDINFDVKAFGYGRVFVLAFQAVCANSYNESPKRVIEASHVRGILPRSEAATLVT